MRYNLISPDGLEVGYITDVPSFRYSVEESAPRYHDVVRFIRDSRDLDMVVTDNEAEPDEFAITPPESNEPATDKLRVIHLASELPDNTPIQVERVQDKADIAGRGPIPLMKERRYVDSPADAPEGVDVQEGPQGGLYYETDVADGETDEAETEINWEVPLRELEEGDGVALQDHDTFNQHHGTVTETSVGGVEITLENGETEFFDMFDPINPLGDWDELGRKEPVGEEEEDEFAGKPYDNAEEREEYLNQLQENRLEEVGFYDLPPKDEGEPQGVEVSDDEVMNTEPNDFGVRASEEDVNTLKSVVETGQLGQELGVVTQISEIPEDTPFGDSDMGRPEAEDPAVDVAIDTADFLHLQFELQNKHFGHEYDSREEHKRIFFGNVQVDSIKEYAEILREEPGEMDYPAMFLRNDGSVDNYQEGRHRGLAAWRAGVDKIPVRVILDADREAKSAPGVEKARRYIQDPSEAPEDVDVEEGPQGGLYYETGDGSGEGEEAPSFDPEIEEVAEAMESNALKVSRNWIQDWLTEKHPDDAVGLLVDGFMNWEIEGIDASNLDPIWGYARWVSGNEEATTPSHLSAPPIPEDHPVTETLQTFTELSRAWLAEHHSNGDGTITLYRSSEGGFGGPDIDGTPVMQSWSYEQDIAEKLSEKYGGEIYETTVPLDWVVFAPDLLWLDTHYAEATLAPPEPIDAQPVEKTATDDVVLKERRYVDDPSEAPEGANVEEGPQGGLYYETEAQEGERTEAPTSEAAEKIANRLFDMDHTEIARQYYADWRVQWENLGADFDTTTHLNNRTETQFNRWSYASDMASGPLWAWAMEKYESESLPERMRTREDPIELPEGFEESFEHHQELTQSVVRTVDPTYDEESDTILLYRGLKGDPAQQLIQERDTDDGATISHRTLESWTSSPEFAMRHGSAIIKRRVPVENVVTSFLSNPHLENERAEAEVVVAFEGDTTENYNLKDIYDSDEDGLIDEWEIKERSDEWISRLVNGP